jgi:hypothetical protein
VLILAVVAVQQSRAAVAPYYRYNGQAYRNAIALSQTLDPKGLVVIGHYGPDVLYYMDRYGWEEDPLAWTPFDEESAIRKGARAFVSIEDNRLRKNLELCAWLQRFPVVNANAQWPVYLTDPAKVKPGALIFWQAFRKAEAAGQGRQFLNAHNACVTTGIMVSVGPQGRSRTSEIATSFRTHDVASLVRLRSRWSLRSP